LVAHRRERLHRALILTFALLLLWLLGNVISPYLAPAGTIDFGDEGAVGPDNSNLISGIDNDLAKFYYTMGDGNCHQKASRSFFLNDNQMPFCSRCTAIFLGLIVGVGLAVFLEMELNLLWIILGLVPIGVDGLLQLVTRYESSNPVRFGTGLLAGIVTGIAIGFIISEISLIVVHRKEVRLRKKEKQ
jgi:uncharacterized membrane protein